MNRRWPALLIASLLPCYGVSQRTDASVPVAPFQMPAFSVGVENFVIYRDRAFAIGEPILVAGPKVTQASWSPDGQFMLLEQARPETRVSAIQGAVLDDKPAPAESYLCVYSLADGRMSDVMRFGDGYHEADIYWLTGAEKALVVVHQDEEAQEDSRGLMVAGRDVKLYVLDATDASIQQFSPWGTDAPSEINVFPSPGQPYAYIDVTFPPSEVHMAGQPAQPQNQASKLLLVTADMLHTTVQIPDSGPAGFPIWSDDGMTGYVILRSPPVKGQPTTPSWYKVSLVDGGLTKVDKPASFYSGDAQNGLISVREVKETSTDEKSTHTVNTLWLETLDPDSQNRAMLAGDGSSGAINKTLEAATYISQGSLYLRPITEVPRRRFEEEKAAWTRTQMMLKARQAGLGLIMYAADNDDTFPSIRDKWIDMLGPYLQSNSVLDGFVYSYPGGPIADIHDPAGTQLGYVDSADGRAVVYADGHVQWSPKS